MPKSVRRRCMRTRRPFAAMITAVTGLVACGGGAAETGCKDHDLDRFISELGNLGITYDYDPSESPVHLRDMADLVVEGALVDLTQAADELVFTVDIAGVLKGDPSAGSDEIRFAEGVQPGGTELRRHRRRVHLRTSRCVLPGVTTESAARTVESVDRGALACVRAAYSTGRRSRALVASRFAAGADRGRLDLSDSRCRTDLPDGGSGRALSVGS